MPTIIGPDGAEHVFPDNTPTSVIKGAMARHYGVKTAPAPGGAAPVSARSKATTFPSVPGVSIGDSGRDVPSEQQRPALPSTPGISIGQPDENVSTPVQWQTDSAAQPAQQPARPFPRNGDADIENLRNYLGVAPGAGPIPAPPSFRNRPSIGGTTPAPVSGIPVEESPIRAGRYTGPAYRAYLGALEIPTGIEQLGARGVDAAAGLAGYNPGATAAADLDAARLHAEQVTAEKEAGYGTQTDLSGEPTASWYEKIDPARVAGSLATGGGLARASTAVIPAGKSLAQGLLHEGARGALMAAAMPVEDAAKDFWGKKDVQSGLGALTGAGLQGISSTVGPWASEKAQRLLAQAPDIPLTIGETVGGAVKYLEDAATSTPFLGTMIRGAQQRSREGFNRATVNEILGIIGEKSKAPVGREMIRDAASKVSGFYNRVVPQMQGKIDAPLTGDIARIRATIPVEKHAAFDDAIQRALMGKTDHRGILAGRDFQAALSDIRNEATGLIKSGGGTFYDKALGHGLLEVNDAVADMAARHNPAELVNALKRANLTFAALTRFERAATSLGAEDGIISASQLANATHAMDRSSRKNAVARGEALLQDYAENAKSVMQRRVPDSGTPARAIVAGGIYGPATAMGAVLPAMATEAGLGALYTPPVQWALRSAAAGAPETRQALSDAMTRRIPVALAAAPAMKGRESSEGGGLNQYNSAPGRKKMEERLP